MRTDSKILNEDEPKNPDRSVSRTSKTISSLPKMSAVVKGKDRDRKPWSETAEITNLSSGGAGFFMSACCEAGSLVSLIMPMPPHMRKYDHDKRLYRVWGLVQYCYQTGGDEPSGFHVGVALIGKDAPESYSEQPNQSYRICGMDRGGLWKVEELERSFKKRSSVRYWNSIETSLFQLDDDNHSISTEKTVTENISESGASVYSNLRVSVGDRIKFQTSCPAFSSLSIVRYRRIGVDDRTRIHLEFVENSFPILDIDAPIEQEGEH
jgi:hypothetical protein